MARRRSMLDLRKTEQAILANGRVDGPELAELRRHLYAGGKIERREADFLVELHKRVQHRTPAFEKFFYQAVKDHILADDKIDDQERKFLHELKGEAKHVGHEFESLFAECMKEPQEQHTCG